MRRVDHTKEILYRVLRHSHLQYLLIGLENAPSHNLVNVSAICGPSKSENAIIFQDWHFHWLLHSTRTISYQEVEIFQFSTTGSKPTFDPNQLKQVKLRVNANMTKNKEVRGANVGSCFDWQAPIIRIPLPAQPFDWQEIVSDYVWKYAPVPILRQYYAPSQMLCTVFYSTCPTRQANSSCSSCPSVLCTYNRNHPASTITNDA